MPARYANASFGVFPGRYLKVPCANATNRPSISKTSPVALKMLDPAPGLRVPRAVRTPTWVARLKLMVRLTVEDRMRRSDGDQQPAREQTVSRSVQRTPPCRKPVRFIREGFTSISAAAYPCRHSVRRMPSNSLKGLVSCGFSCVTAEFSKMN